MVESILNSIAIITLATCVLLHQIDHKKGNKK